MSAHLNRPWAGLGAKRLVGLRRAWWSAWAVIVALGAGDAAWTCGLPRLLIGVTLDTALLAGTYSVFALLLPRAPTVLPRAPRAVVAAASALVASMVTFIGVGMRSAPLAWVLLVLGIVTFPRLADPADNRGDR